MTYFYLYAHCYLIKGEINYCIYDIFQKRLFWLDKSPYRGLIAALEAGNPLEEICERLEIDYNTHYNFLKFIEHMDYGTFHKKPIFSEKYRPYLLSSQEERFFIHRPLQQTVVEISNKCSHNCKICGFKGGKPTTLCACGVWSGKDKSRYTINIEKTIDEIAGNGCKKILIQGGDPFLNKDILYTWINEAKKKNIKVTIQCPPQVFEKNEWDYICQNDIKLIIPLWSHEPNIYENMTGVKGSYEALIDLMNKNKNSKAKPISIKLILTQETFLDKKDILNFITNYSINRVFIDCFVDDKHTEDEVKLKQFKQFFYKNNKASFKILNHQFFRASKGHSCWQDQLAITYNGDVIPCIAARNHIIGSIKNDGLLKDIIRLKQHFPYRNLTKDNYKPCNLCEFRYNCLGCSLMTERTFGDMKNREWNCRYDPVAGTFTKEL